MKQDENDNKRQNHDRIILDCNLLSCMLSQCKCRLVDMVERNRKKCMKLKETKELSQEQK